MIGEPTISWRRVNGEMRRLVENRIGPVRVFHVYDRSGWLLGCALLRTVVRSYWTTGDKPVQRAQRAGLMAAVEMLHRGRQAASPTQCQIEVEEFLAQQGLTKDGQWVDPTRTQV